MKIKHVLNNGNEIENVANHHVDLSESTTKIFLEISKRVEKNEKHQSGCTQECK